MKSSSRKAGGDRKTSFENVDVLFCMEIDKVQKSVIACNKTQLTILANLHMKKKVTIFFADFVKIGMDLAGGGGKIHFGNAEMVFLREHVKSKKCDLCK